MFKGVHGGRCGAKDWSFTQALLWLSSLYNSPTAKNIDKLCADVIKKYGCQNADTIRFAASRPMHIWCLRETHVSIKDSIHQLLCDRIHALDADKYFDITESEIRCIANGSFFRYSHLLHNVHNIKSQLEGCTIAYVGEAENISKDSWEKFIKTIFRVKGCECWIAWNDQYEDDDTHQRFIVNTPPKTIVKFINSNDVEEVLTEEQKLLRQSDKARMTEAEFKHTWEGGLLGSGRLVCPVFDEKVHVKEFDWNKIRSRANFFCACDPAQQYYPFFLWGAKIPIDAECTRFIKWVFAEWPRFDTFGDYFCNVRKNILYSGSLADIAKEVYGTEIQHGIPQDGITARFIDTHFTDGVGANSYLVNKEGGIIENFRKPINGGLVFIDPPTAEIHAQQRNIIRDFQYNTMVSISPLNEPSLYISANCQNLKYSLKSHRLEMDNSKESEKHKDSWDTLEILYAGMERTAYINPKKLQAEIQRVGTAQTTSGIGKLFGKQGR